MSQVMQSDSAKACLVQNLVQDSIANVIGVQHITRFVVETHCGLGPTPFPLVFQLGCHQMAFEGLGQACGQVYATSPPALGGLSLPLVTFRGI